MHVNNYYKIVHISIINYSIYIITLHTIKININIESIYGAKSKEKLIIQFIGSVFSYKTVVLICILAIYCIIMFI